MKSRNTEIFTKGLTHEFDQHLNISLFLFLDKMGIEIMVDDRLDKEQAHLDKKFDSTDRCRIEIFLKDLTHDFGQKLDMSSLFFQQNKPRVMSHDYLIRKRALLDYKK